MTALWRKQILPLGTIPWQDRELSFTPAYLGDMAAAFVARARDVVPFAAEIANGAFSNDPSLIRGVVRSLEVVADGMDAVVEVDAEVDALLDDALLHAKPGPATGARIIEHYRTWDGREFPVVLAGVYTTRAPSIISLRPWTREDSDGKA